MANLNTKKIHDKRPLSPHLTIYKPQLSSITSILHRITGVWLFIGLIGFIWWVVCSIYTSFDNAIAKPEIFETVIGRLVLLSWTISLFYHFLNGIRHLIWDAGYGFNIKTADKTGLLVIFGTLVLTTISWIIALGLI